MARNPVAVAQLAVLDLLETLKELTVEEVLNDPQFEKCLYETMQFGFWKCEEYMQGRENINVKYRGR